MSSQRIITFALDDLAVDPDSVVDALNDACTHRHEHYRIRGVCQLDQKIYFVLLSLDANEPARSYVLTSIDDISSDGFVAMLENRWASNFDTVGTIKVYDTVMALFESQRD
jgi:hypothetical protein